MIVIDANLLLYACDTSSVHHQASRQWFEGILSGDEPVGLTWAALLAFLRIGTDPRIRKDAFSVEEAIAIAAGWLERPTVTLLSPGERHWEILRSIMIKGQARGPLVTDAHLAALAIEHGAILATCDRDFARFPGLKFFNPLDPH
jgi:uncharacterized protein